MAKLCLKNTQLNKVKYTKHQRYISDIIITYHYNLYAYDKYILTSVMHKSPIR